MANRIYAQGRLTNAPARLTSLDFSDRVDGWVDSGALGMFTKLTEHCFLPCRDDEAGVTTEEDYFKSDVNAINNSIGVAGFFDGQTFDSGCAFEVGYGYAKGCAVNLITTDFFKYYPGDSKECYNISKLMEHIASIVHYSGPPNPPAENYRQQINDIIEEAYNQFLQNLHVTYRDFELSPLQAQAKRFDYYLDPNFKNTETARWLLDKITQSISDAGKTYVIGDNVNDIDNDISNLIASEQAIFYSDAYEPDVDSGILQGIAYAMSSEAGGNPGNKKPIVYCSKSQRFHSGFADALLNGMIRYSAEAVVASFDELLTHISK